MKDQPNEYSDFSQPSGSISIAKSPIVDLSMLASNLTNLHLVASGNIDLWGNGKTSSAGYLMDNILNVTGSFDISFCQTINNGKTLDTLSTTRNISLVSFGGSVSISRTGLSSIQIPIPSGDLYIDHNLDLETVNLLRGYGNTLTHDYYGYDHFSMDGNSDLGGSFAVSNCPALENITAAGITQVGGSFVVDTRSLDLAVYNIHGNPSSPIPHLKTLSFPNLDSIGGDFNITDNYFGLLQRVTFPSLETIGGTVNLDGQFLSFVNSAIV
jgi:hypothetical protein